MKEENYYQLLTSWCKGWGWSKLPPKSHYSTTGIMVENNGQKICSCFLYKTDSAWCILNWFLMNPKATKKNRIGCLDYLIEQSILIAKLMGFQVIDVMIDKDSLIKRLEKHGFNLKENITRVVKIL